MSAEIDRLERQARILADLKGVSIYELKHALQSACEAEAHGELRALVGTLQARVEGLQLGGGRKRDDGEKTTSNDDANNNNLSIPSQDQFNAESAARARASLELRIGELEEIGMKQTEELDTLYKSTKVLTQKNSLLETQLLQQKALLDQWESRWKAKEEEDMEHIGNITAILTSKSEQQSQIDTELEQRLIAAQAALAGEESQRLLVQSQLDSAQITYELKIEQSQHRIQFLEEQLQDLELQMTSLYTAFGMIQHDNTEERSEKEAWKRYLEESDAAFAKEEYERENKQQTQSPTANIPSTVVSPEPPDRNSSLRSTTGGLFSYPLSPPTTSTAVSSPPSYSPTRALVKPSTYPPIVKGRLLLLLDNIGQPIKPNDCITYNQSSPPKSMSFAARKLISSTKRLSSSTSTENRFKLQYCVLHGANGLYQIRYGDSYDGPVVGVHEFITAGVSSIEVSTSWF